MENKKQSSIEWLQDCLSIHFTHDQKMQFEGLFQQAIAMEKEYKQKLADDAFRLGLETGKVFKSIKL